MKTSDAIRTIVRCHAVIAVNAIKAVDKAVKTCPWVFIIAIGLIAAISSAAGVGNARAERDNASKKVVALQDTLDNYKMLVESYQYKYNK